VTRLGDFEDEGAVRARDLFGSVWRTDRLPAHLEEPALSEPDLAGFSLPGLDTVFRQNWREEGRRRCEALREQGRFVMAVIGYGLFERSWTLRGFENALTDMALHPDFYAELLDLITEFYLRIIERLVQLPIDGIQTGDDWGHQQGLIMGIERWRRFFRPRYARLWQRIKDAGLYTMHHSCGNVSEVVGEVADAGLDCLESLQPEAMSPYALKEEFGEKIAFWGGLGTQQLLPRGTPEQVRAEVKRLCTEMARGGGYVLAPSKPVMTEVPTENAAALLEATLEQAGTPL
jgi:uroporphyrinogen decarboxylase